MTRGEIIQKIHKAHRHLLRADVEAMLDAINESVGEAVAMNRRVELRGFGVFEPKKLNPKRTFSPQGKAPLDLGARLSMKFKAGKQLLTSVNKE